VADHQRRVSQQPYRRTVTAPVAAATARSSTWPATRSATSLDTASAASRFDSLDDSGWLQVVFRRCQQGQHAPTLRGRPIGRQIGTAAGYNG